MNDGDVTAPPERRRAGNTHPGTAPHPTPSPGGVRSNDAVPPGAGPRPDLLRGPGAQSAARRSLFSRPSVFSHRIAGYTRSTGRLDLLVVLACFASMHVLYLGDLDFTSDRVLVLSAAVALLAGGFSAGGLYREDRARALHEEIGRLTVCWALALAGIGLFAFLSKTGEEVSRVWVGSSMLLALLSLSLVRILRGVFMASRAAAEESVDVVVVGAGDAGALALERVAGNAWTGMRVVGVFDDRATGVGGRVMLPDGRDLDGTVDELFQFVESRRRAGAPVDQVWIALPLSRQSTIDEITARLRDSSVDVCIVPDAFGLRLLSGAVTRVGELRVVNVSEIALPPRAELFKRVFDCTVASLAITVLALPMALIALAVRCESRGPALFRQRRYGIDGREIEVWKFRSMRVLENGEEVRQATRGDARVTAVGRFIRRTSLDELPQFFNVLQGRMSIVGPRPHAVVHNESWRRQISGYMLRHKIKPGITGWAQVNGWRGETDTFEKMERRVHFDLEYIRNWSPWLDVKILFLTVARGFSGKHVY